MGLSDRYELIGDGDKIKYCYLKNPNPHRVNVIASPGKLPHEFGLEQYLDYDKQFERAFVAPLQILLDAIGWNVEHKATLDSFF
jgi:hypothetical protein